MKNMFIDILELIEEGEAFGHTVFFEYVGHVKNIRITVTIDGWEEGRHSSAEKYFSVRSEKAESYCRRALREIRSLPGWEKGDGWPLYVI